jgi:hypothetical protein
VNRPHGCTHAVGGQEKHEGDAEEHDGMVSERACRCSPLLVVPLLRALARSKYVARSSSDLKKQEAPAKTGASCLSSGDRGRTLRLEDTHKMEHEQKDDES